MDNPIVASTRHLDAPWIAAHLAVLNEAAVDVRLDVDFQVLAAKGTRDQELVWHFGQSYCNAAPCHRHTTDEHPPLKASQVP